jgi:RNA recognition motif-containing protein
MKSIYVGNIPFSASQDDLYDMFQAYGQVSSVKVVADRETGRPRGFAFVEMEDDGEAMDAISALDGSEMGGRNLRVNEARPREPRDRGRRW